MEIDLQSIKAAELSAPEQEIFNDFRESLISASDEDAKRVNLVNRIDQLCPQTSSEEQVETVLWNLWLVMLDIARLVPADHPWQHVLVGALSDLRLRDRPDKIPLVVRLFPDRGDISLLPTLTYS